MVLLTRPYGGYASGTICEFPASTEAALIAQGFATASSAVATSGAVTNNAMRGVAAVAIGASSVVVTNSNVDVTSFVTAIVNQAAADATALRVERVSVAAGSFTIFVTAAATAATEVSWAIINNMPTVPN